MFLNSPDRLGRWHDPDAQMTFDATGLLRTVTLPTSASTLPTVSDGTPASMAKAEGTIDLAHNAAGDLIRITDALNNAMQLGTGELSRTTTSPDLVSTGH